MEFGIGIVLNPQHDASESLGFEVLGFNKQVW